MEKLLYLLWQPDNTPDWTTRLKQDLVTSCQRHNATQLRLNLADEDVANAASMRMTPTPPLPDALMTFWLDSASQRFPIEKAMTALCARFAGYCVSESEPLPNVLHPGTSGNRTYGMNHVVFLVIPAHLTREQWLDAWLTHHTPVAIETQENFGYRQNLVVRPLTEGAPAIDAFVEENFAPAAIGNQDAFYKRGTPEELKSSQKKMYQSCSRFIDFTQFSRLPTSEYNY